jgi:hypothetical protein
MVRSEYDDWRPSTDGSRPVEHDSDESSTETSGVVRKGDIICGQCRVISFGSKNCPFSFGVPD